MNFKKIFKKYRSLKCPEGYFDPTLLPYNQDKYFVICTERKSGKTTNVLLLAMCQNWLEGNQIVYIRQSSEMIERRNLRQLFDAILAFDYIEKITEGRYKNLVYQSHGWYYCNYDEDGKVIDRTMDPFMLCLSVDQVDTYKSPLNTNALIIIYDEFISRRYYQDEFIWFCDIISTCFRRPEQDEGFIFMLANTIDREHQYFYEMELNDAIHKLPIGASTEIITSGGTPIYLELYTRGQTPEKTRHNRLFYGFKNKKLGSITGQEWSLTPLPQPKADDTRTVLARRWYIQYEDKMINLELCRTDNDGLHIIAHFATQGPKKDSTIYSMGLMMDWRYHYKFGHDRADKLIWTLYERKKWYFTSNAVGAIVNKYYQNAKEYRRLY